MQQVLTIIFLLIGIAVGIVALVKAIPRRWRRRRYRSDFQLNYEIELERLRNEFQNTVMNMQIDIANLKHRVKKLKRAQAFPTLHKKTNDEKPPFIPVPHNSPERL